MNINFEAFGGNAADFGLNGGDCEIGMDFSKPFPDVDAEDDVYGYRNVAIGVYNNVFGAYQYSEIRLTAVQVKDFAELHFKYYGPAKGKSDSQFNIKNEIVTNAKWTSLIDVLTQLDTAIAAQGGRTFIRCDDMSPKDVSLESIDKTVSVVAQKHLEWSLKENDVEGCDWAQRLIRHQQSAITSSEDAIDLLVRSSRVFLVAQSYHFHNHPLNFMVAKYDDQIDQGQEFRTFIDEDGDMFGISTYKHVSVRKNSPIISAVHPFCNLVATTIQDKWRDIRDDIIDGRKDLKTQLATVQGLTQDAFNIIATYCIDHRRIADFCVTVDVDLMKAVYVRFIECNPLDTVTDPNNFGDQVAKAVAQSDFSTNDTAAAVEKPKDNKTDVQSRYNYTDVYRLMEQNRAAINSKRPKTVEVRISRCSLRGAFEGTKLAKGGTVPPSTPYATHMAEFNTFQNKGVKIEVIS